MNVAMMRRLDRWLGIPACFLLTALRRAGDLFRRPDPDLAVKKILIVKPAEQGATVLAYPALRRAVEMVGRENVFFLVFEENRFILDCLDVIPEENVIAVASRGALGTLAGLFGGMARVRRIGVDAAVDLEFFARSSAVLAYLSGAPVRVGLHRDGDPAPYRGDLMTHRIRYNPDLHTMQAFLQMIEAAGMAAEEIPSLLESPPEVEAEYPEFAVTDEELEALRKKMREEAGADEVSPLVLLNANASDLIPLRRWPTERYVELARRLLERDSKLRIAFTGAPDERSRIEPILAEIGSDRCFCMAGRTTLRELLVLYHLANVLVTNDSGPAHFAAITPIQTVTLFGPETPALFGARSPRSHILWRGLPCSPCVSAYNNRLSPCRNNRCMQEIEVDEVFEKVWQLLESSSAS